MMPPLGDVLHYKNHPAWDSRQLWSLADMINFYLSNFMSARNALWQEVLCARRYDEECPVDSVPESLRPRIERNVKIAIRDCVAALQIEAASDTSIELEKIFAIYVPGTFQAYNWKRLRRLLDNLWDQIDLGLHREVFHHYPSEMANLLFSIDSEWKPVTDKFPLSESEISRGLDCYALEDYAGCVFHMIRIAELGLRQIAKELKMRTVKKAKPIEFAMWGELIRELSNEIERISNTKGNNKPMTIKQRQQREAKGEKYKIVLSDINALHALRDRTIHFRDSYDPGQAFSAISRVKELMLTLVTT